MAKTTKARLIQNVIAIVTSLVAFSLHIYLSLSFIGLNAHWQQILALTTSSIFVLQTCILGHASNKLNNHQFLYFSLVVLLLTFTISIAASNDALMYARNGLYFFIITAALWVINLIIAYKAFGLLGFHFNRLGLAYKRMLDKNKSLTLTINSLKSELEEQDADLNYRLGERNLELEIALRELSDRNQELERLSAIDSLTGLMNRRYFDKRMLAETRRSKREQTPLGIALLDIDHFKKINDKYGHLCGDHCLKEFSKILQDEIKRPSDTISRYGGEEFVMILPNTDQDGVYQLLERIRARLEKTVIYFEVNQFVMTVSIGGCSRIVENDSENISLIGFVDNLLYKAKESGRNKTIVKPFE